jgi:chemotaxis protein MotB
MRLHLPRLPRQENPLWLIIFSDLSTNLMLFFLLMFAMTRLTAAEREMMVESMERATGFEQAIKERELREQKEEAAIRTLQATIAYGRLKEYTQMSVNEKEIKLTIELPFFFASGSAVLHPDARPALQSLVIPISEFPNDIIIEGHTDNVPIMTGRYPSNWELSVARAVSVIEFFEKEGVESGKMVAGGYGEYHPVAPNDTVANKAKNRRIEITILRQPGET